MLRSALLATLLGSRLAYGWWTDEHVLVVRIAERMLQQPARARIQATLAPGESLATLSSWADEVRPLRKETEAWHYVNIPLSSAGLDMRRDCPRNKCVVGKIADFRKSWSDPAVSPADRREALLFLVHLVADVHQPLHCADNGDEGGNHLPVRFLGQRTNLHALWDGLLLEHISGRLQLFARLSAAITSQRVAEWSKGTVEQWASESFHIAQHTAYDLLPQARKRGAVEITAGYWQTAEPVLEQQLEKAAVRLAAILNGSAQ